MSDRTLRSLSTKSIYIAPSLLAADFASLGPQVEAAEAAGADFFHLDIMDGHFVPNLSFGAGVVRAVRSYTDLPFDVHLMISDPDAYFASFVTAGADHITIHVESQGDTAATLQTIRDHGCSAGLSLKPGTALDAVLPFLDIVDLVLVMTVEPGFGGQAFMTDMLPRIQALRDVIDRDGHAVHVQVDGGITAATAALARDAGARMLVAGTSVFKAPEGMQAAIRSLRAPATTNGDTQALRSP